RSCRTDVRLVVLRGHRPMMTFQKCAACTYAPDLCASCRHNRELIEQLSTQNTALTDVYAVAALLRQFPVPFNDHLTLVDAVDKCRAILEPPVDNYNDAPTLPSAWQAHVDAHPRAEFLAMFRQAHATLHKLW